MFDMSETDSRIFVHKRRPIKHLKWPQKCLNMVMKEKIMESSYLGNPESLTLEEIHIKFAVLFLRIKIFSVHFNFKFKFPLKPFCFLLSQPLKRSEKNLHNIFKLHCRQFSSIAFKKPY